jgi:hypothetical protein
MKTGELSGRVFARQLEKVLSCSHAIRKVARSITLKRQIGLLVLTVPTAFEHRQVWSPYFFYMKALLLIICALALAFLSGCVSQDTTKLHIGMTKDEVIQVMGKPDSVGSDGHYEYLNYQMTRHSTHAGPTFISASGNMVQSTGTSTMTQRYTVRLADGKVVSYGVGGQTR